MAGVLFKAGLAAVALAVFFQVALKETIWLAFGIGRVLQPISDFPYTCRKIVDPRMEACEDMWLSESTRQLFLACSDSLARSHWMPKYVPKTLERLPRQLTQPAPPISTSRQFPKETQS